MSTQLASSKIGLPATYSQETAIAKAKKRVAPRKKSSKRGKAGAKPARKTAAKRTTPKKAKSKGPAWGRCCSETRGQEKAVTEDRGKKATKKCAKTSRCA